MPVNLTLVQEGAGQFFATQGDDKCAMDEVHQESQRRDALPPDGARLLHAAGTRGAR